MIMITTEQLVPGGGEKTVKGEVDLGTIHVGDTEGPDCLNVVDDLSDEIRAGTKWKSVTGAGGGAGRASMTLERKNSSRRT